MRQTRRAGPAEVQPGQFGPRRRVILPGDRRTPPHVPVPLLVEPAVDGYPADLAGRLQQPERRRQRSGLPLLAARVAQVADRVAELILELGRVQRLRADHVEDGRAQLVDLAARDAELREYRQVCLRRATPDLQRQ